MCASCLGSGSDPGRAATSRSRGRDVELGPGQAMLRSSTEAGNMVVPVSPSRFVGLRLPRKALVLVRDPEDMLIRPLPSNTEAMRLLALYIRELDDSYQLATPELRGAVVRHLVDLGATSQTAFSASLCAVAHTTSPPNHVRCGRFQTPMHDNVFHIVARCRICPIPVAPVRACQSSRA
nr:hypothetical protein [Bradyrhizobium pachyrhizi]